MSWLSVLECPLDVKEVTGPPFTMSRNTTLSPIFSQDQEREREAVVVVKISLSHAASWECLDDCLPQPILQWPSCTSSPVCGTYVTD